MKKHGTRLLLALLGACAAGGTPSAPAPAPEDAGARIYSGNCMPCHQQEGRGIAGVYPSLAGSPVVLGVKGQRTAAMPAASVAAALGD